MANAAYWFRHDTNAKDDHKIMLLMDQLGLEGYGIYWILIEVLREQDGYVYPLSMLPILAKRYYSSAEKFKAVVLNYELFDILEGDNFSSLSLLRRMGEYDKYCEQRRLAGRKGGLKKIDNAKHMLSIPVACAKHEDSTGLPSGEERSGEDRNREEKSKKKKSGIIDISESIYQSYPKKVDKGHALKAIKNALEKVDAQVLLDAVKRYSAQWNGKDKQFCPNPASWFNGERWDDETPTPEISDPYGIGDLRPAEDVLREMGRSV